MPQAPDQYGHSWNTNTFGLNSFGYTNENQQFFNSALLGANFTNADNLGVFARFSGGMIGPGCPEPSSLILLGSGLMGAVFAARRRFS